MTLNLALRIDGNTEGAKRAIAETRAEVANLNKVMADSNNLAASLDRQFGIGGNDAFAKRGADIEAYGRALDNIRAKHNPLFAAQQQYKAGLSEIRQAHAIGAISADEMAAAVQRQKTAFAGQVGIIRGHTNGLKLNQQQLMNMQFQMNDMAVMLASGQSPFVMMMQQGMQIGQIFGPGATVGQALKATGAGIVSFLTNPIMLTVAASAVLAGGIGLMFDAFSGPEAKSAEETLSDINDLLSQMKEQYEDVGGLAKGIIDAPLSAPRLQVKLEIQKDTAEDKLNEALEGLQRQADGLSINWLNYSEDLEQTHNVLRGMLRDLEMGEISGTDFADAIARMQLDPSLSDDAREAVRLFADGADEADKWARNIRGIELAIDQASGKVLDFAEKQELAIYKLTQGLRNQSFTGFDADGALGLRDQYNQQVEQAEREAQRAAERAEREAERAAKEAQRRAEQHAMNEIVIEDLEAEIFALSQSGDVRDELLEQLKEEQQIRAAIASLGKDATAAEIASMRTLIPLKNDWLKANRAAEEASRDTDNAARAAASGIASTARQLYEGANAADLFRDKFLDLAFSFAEQALYGAFGGTGGGMPWVNLIAGLFGAGTGTIKSPTVNAAVASGAGGLYSKGGYTGGNDPAEIAGFVHGKEYVFDAKSTERIGVDALEAMRQGALRGYRTGGYVGPSAPSRSLVSAPMAPQFNISMIDQAGTSQSVDARQNDRGGFDIDILIERKVSANIASGKHDKPLMGRLNTSRRGVRR